MNAGVEAKDVYLAQFAEQGFPTTREEEWRYTSVAPIQRNAFRPAAKDLTGLTAQRLQPFVFQDLSCHRLVFIDGYFAPQLSALAKLPDGVIVSSLADAINSGAAFLQRHLAHYAPIDRYGFAALNTAFLADGACIYLPRGVMLAEPVHLLFVSTARDQSVLAQPRNLVVAEAKSRAILIESYIGLDEARYFTNAITEVVVAEGATIEHYKLGEESAKAYHIGGLHGR